MGRKDSRVRAEEVMADLGEIAPRLAEAYEAYLNLSVAYYDRWDRLRYWHGRGVVSDEELASFPARPMMKTSEKPFGKRLKEYRASKRAE